jgi:hypothetical protein
MVNTDEVRYLADITHEKSHVNPVLQAVDMVAGAAYRARVHNDDSLLRIVRSHIDDVWDWAGLDDAEGEDAKTDGVPNQDTDQSPGRPRLHPETVRSGPHRG